MSLNFIILPTVHVSTLVHKGTSLISELVIDQCAVPNVPWDSSGTRPIWVVFHFVLINYMGIQLLENAYKTAPISPTSIQLLSNVRVPVLEIILMESPSIISVSKSVLMTAQLKHNNMVTTSHRHVYSNVLQVHMHIRK